MIHALFFLVPALVLQAQSPPIRDVGGGIHVLKGSPTAETFTELKRLHFTLVIDCRQDGDVPEGLESEASALAEAGIGYMRYALGRTPPAGDFRFFMDFLRTLPRGSRVLVHCTNGNRAAAAVCPWLVLERGLKVEEALRVCREAGLALPETENAVRQYLLSQKKS